MNCQNTSLTEAPSKRGSVPGAVLLIAGCCIGAGMLGLPVMSAMAGFKPSLVMFFIGWLFMTTTALLFLEVNLWFRGEVSMISMAGRTLGTAGKSVCWLCFLFLFYTLGVAYIAGSGELIADFVQELFGTRPANWVGSFAVSALFGIFVYLGTRSVDLCNRILMFGLAASYILLVAFGAPHVHSEYLNYSDWSVAAAVLPIMIISFGFHNMIPSLTTYLDGDAKRLRLAILCGSALPLGIYLVWEWLMLGLVPVHGEGGFVELVENGEMATELLRRAIGASWVVDIAQYFAFFAILTSFLGNSLSFVDFLADGLRIKKDKVGKCILCLLVIAPPFAMTLAYPTIFLKALTYAGAFGAVILFGILPVMMVWAGRYRRKIDGVRIVPGGKALLLIVTAFALAVMSLQLLDIFTG